jgi:hypothetical protein
MNIHPSTHKFEMSLVLGFETHQTGSYKNALSFNADALVMK